ncbi:hypothetical protein K0M31_014694 [Melipona bicolor]|uniref:Uncharacterized protein n=1 Tax=Melipona bicolor TaxID=60889 RepID=A0AA40FH26_9HYME|nr:hypothetical protein K0M31_014694 [Melipona bicolor]
MAWPPGDLPRMQGAATLHCGETGGGWRRRSAVYRWQRWIMSMQMIVPVAVRVAQGTSQAAR